ncbi:MAG: HNH endonuclease [Clostridium sp.]|jgi:hypothetical protein|nr:HNH endonuclease [Clostridium sp.]
MSKEVWKDIEGYEGKYQVSNEGKVRTLNYKRTGRMAVMSPCKSRWGYVCVNLWNNGQRKFRKIHRLVAMAYLENPNELPFVHHKDENKTNNNVSNLEWSSVSHNTQSFVNNHPEWKQKIGDAQLGKSKPSTWRAIEQRDLQGNVVSSFCSIKDVAKKTHLLETSIVRCCKGKAKTCGGYKWQYAARYTESEKTR